MFHECETCGAKEWMRPRGKGSNESIYTSTGLYDDGWDYWIFNRDIRDWDDEQSDLELRDEQEDRRDQRERERERERWLRETYPY